MTSVLVVCIANICRSPIAEAYFKRYAPKLRVASAGVNALTGHHADPNSIEICKNEGIDIASHRATMLNVHLIHHADYIFVMDQRMLEIVSKKFPAAIDKIYTLGHHTQEEIVDPYGKDIKYFAEVAHRIDESVKKWILKLNERSNG
jgi:protein-tyrosine phosphatase